MENNQFFEQGLRPLNLEPAVTSADVSANLEADDAQRMRFYNLSFGDECFFNVLTTPVLYDDRTGRNNIVAFPSKKVIVDASEHRGISIVRKGFYVVSHKEAMQLGCRIFQEIFGVLPSIHQQHLNGTKTDYTVDLVSDECKIVINREGYHYHNPYRDDYRVDLFQSERVLPMNDVRIPNSFRDVYHPFIRVSNFLRDGVSMVIQMGYYRARCSNGMLFDLSLPLRFSHSYFVPTFAKIELDALRYFKLNQRYMFTMAEQLWKLMYLPVRRDIMGVITYDMFHAQLDALPIAKQKKLLMELDSLVEKYSVELGENMNAAINVATDFSKLLGKRQTSTFEVQRIAGEWMHRVTHERFDWSHYQGLLEEKRNRLTAVLTES